MNHWWEPAFAPKLTEAVTSANALGVAIAMYYLWRDGASGMVLAIGAGAAIVGLFMSISIVQDVIRCRGTA